MKLRQIVNLNTRRQEILDIVLTNLFPYYNSPVIIPPVQPDIPGQGVPSDHSVPLCIPHTDPDNPPARSYKTVVSRPLPDSKVRKFGEWITHEQWDGITEGGDPSILVKKFEQIIEQKLNHFFPQKITKIGVGDPPYITSELKTLKRKRMRMYRKHGKNDKYLKLKAEFDEKLEKAAGDYLKKNLESLKESNPSKAYNILKKMGAQPGEYDEVTFSLPGHENLDIQEAADKIAEHFSKISQEYPPLNQETLPERVKVKVGNPETESKMPTLSEHEVYTKICDANKPKSGVPGDLPRRLVSEFAPELSTPVCAIFNNILKSAKQGVAEWPATWHQEFGTPLQKVSDPQTEDDLRIISLTPFFSKVMEKFVVNWLMTFIGGKLDPKQFGGLKGNSISHYMIELVNFILYNQDYDLPIAVLVCSVDFAKAFNRQNHNLLIIKLSDMGVPGWLLNLVMGFLSERSMVVKYKGTTTERKSLPGGGPQGTLLGLLLFLVLINDCGSGEHVKNIGEQITNKKDKFTPQTFHAKYVDDLMIAESFNLEETLLPNPDRPFPDSYHSRLGQKLPEEKSVVYGKIKQINEYANENEMKLNFSKTKFITFNPTLKYDFEAGLNVDGKEVESVENMKLLGLTITTDMKWRTNTDVMTKKAYGKLWILKRLKMKGATIEDMKDVYYKQVRSILEFGVPVWSNGITLEEVTDIERVQKSFMYIALGKNYINYGEGLVTLDMETLAERRIKLCETFALRSAKNPKHSQWFKTYKNIGAETRSTKTTYRKPLPRLDRYKDSPIPYLTSLLNSK